VGPRVDRQRQGAERRRHQQQLRRGVCSSPGWWRVAHNILRFGWAQYRNHSLMAAIASGWRYLCLANE
jgi:hypothetical protein